MTSVSWGEFRKITKLIKGLENVLYREGYLGQRFFNLELKAMNSACTGHLVGKK